MEGPTPVSALIHAATMVTAGIFLMLRLANLFTLEESLMSVIAIIGAFTAFFGATTGSAQTDIKKIIAFSTCSQLGYMVAACGLGNFAVAFFHLITHAFFKSLLFLCAGIVIHTLNGEQDIRKMGFLLKALPTAFISMLIAALALSGIPYFAGFYSKEMILSVAYLTSVFETSSIAMFVFIMLIKAAIFTSFYSAKLIFYIFIKESGSNMSIVKNIHTDGQDFLTTQLPLLVLSIFSVFSGLLFKDMIVGPAYSITLNPFSEFIVQGNLNVFIEYLPVSVKILLFLVSISGFLYYFIIINFKKEVSIIVGALLAALKFIGYTETSKNILFFYSKIKSELYSFLYNR